MAYLTLKNSGTADFHEKKSHFIGYAMPVADREAAERFIAEISKKHHAAKHNVFAYILKNGEKRMSDNGEPQGTAGAPILEYLEKSGITDAVLVVTRYFGGILLGTGGLTRAYTLAAKLAAENAGIVQMSDCTELTLQCDYNMQGKISYLAAQNNIKILSSDFSEYVVLRVRCKSEATEKFRTALSEISGGKIKIYDEEKIFAEF